MTPEMHASNPRISRFGPEGKCRVTASYNFRGLNLWLTESFGAFSAA
jgi:hypothetical protein